MAAPPAPETGAGAGARRPRLSTVAFAVAALVAVGSAVALKLQTPVSTVTAQAGAAEAAASAPLSAASASTAPTPTPGPDAVAMVARLEAQLRREPDNREGWQMLGRAYGVMGRDKEAIEVYRRIVSLAAAAMPPDPASLAQAHADLGRAIGRASGRKLTPEADAELQKALALDPGNVMAHALLGRTSFESGDAAAAKRHWEQALAGVDGGHPFAQQLRQSIELADGVLQARVDAAASAARAGNR